MKELKSIADIQSLIINTFNTLHFDGKPSELYSTINYSLNMGGKRVRPLLTLLACDMFGGNIDNALSPAIAVELFHNFTLIHDDILDKAPLRRGMKTVYTMWNTDIAILSGDTLFALAYKYVTDTDIKYIKAVTDTFIQASILVCEGQQMDMNFEKNGKVSLEEYINMIRLKTAALIAGSLKIGAIVAGADDKDADNLYKYGENIGIAFQIMDDMLDVYAIEDKFGKSSCGDIKTNKKTYLFIKAAELAKKSMAEELRHLFSGDVEDIDKKVKAVKKIYDSVGIKAFAEQEINDYYKKAVTYLDAVNIDNQMKNNLRLFTDKLMVRQF